MPRAPKAPAYQWYPKDYMADPVVQRMTLEQEGAYHRLLDACWLENGLPTDPDHLWSIAGCDSREHWDRIGTLILTKFFDRRGRLHQKRLDRERRHQAKNRRKRQLAAKVRWDKEHQERDTHASALQCPPTATATATPSSTAASTATPVKTFDRRAPLFSGSRLRVTARMHRALLGALGSVAETVDLVARYPEWNAELEASGEPVDALPWLKVRAFAVAGVGNAVFNGGRDRPITQDERKKAEQYRRSVGRCPHEPSCGSTSACVGNLIRRWRAQEEGVA